MDGLFKMIIKIFKIYFKKMIMEKYTKRVVIYYKEL
jgi:hypothetical protein